jgi:4-aminobutyrate aminotransferase-like enzyme
MFGCDYAGVVPDIMTIGKGMGGGFPVSGLVSTAEIMSATPFSKPSASSSSYGGNPLAATASLATLQTIIEENLVQHTARVGAILLDELRLLQEKYAFIGDVRGKGLLIGLDLVKDRTTKEPLAPQVTERIFHEALRRGLLLMGYFHRVRINPPLVITEEEVREGVDILDEVFHCISDEVDYQHV